MRIFGSRNTFSWCLMLFGWSSYVYGLFNFTSVPMRVSVNKLNLVLNRKVPVSLACSETGELWVRVSRRVPSFSIYSFTHWSLCFTPGRGFTDIHFAAFTWNIIDNTVCWDGSRASFGRTKCNLSVVSDLKTVRTPCCCRQRRRTSDAPLI